MMAFADINDVRCLWRELKTEECECAERLLETISDSLRYEASKVGKDLDRMIEEDECLKSVAKSVTVDVLARTLLTNKSEEAMTMTQVSQSALGYSSTGTFLVPGGGLFIKKSELNRLGLRRQRVGVIDFYGDD